MALDWYEKLIGNYNRSSERIQQDIHDAVLKTSSSSSSSGDFQVELAEITKAFYKAKRKDGSTGKSRKSKECRVLSSSPSEGTVVVQFLENGVRHTIPEDWIVRGTSQGDDLLVKNGRLCLRMQGEPSQDSYDKRARGLLALALMACQGSVAEACCDLMMQVLQLGEGILGSQNKKERAQMVQEFQNAWQKEYDLSQSQSGTGTGTQVSTGITIHHRHSWRRRNTRSYITSCPNAMARGYSEQEETQLDELSRWLAPILRDPEKARKKGLERSIDGWAKLEDVQRILRRSRLHESAHLFRQMLDWSRYDIGREAGNPRFQVEDWEGERYIRAAKKVRSERSSPMPRSGEENEATPAAPPETTAAPAAAEQKPSASSKPRCRVLPHPAYEKICLSLKSLKEMKAVMAVSKDWKQGVEPLLRCPGRKNPALCGIKQSKLPCGHSVCAKCQEERRKCPKCGALSRHAGDYVDLRSYDDPRSSLPADTASIYTTSDAPVARHYRWVCRPEESEAPFTENSELDAAEARWAKFPDHGTNLVTRYWGFLQNGLRVSAVVYCLKHSVYVRSPSEENLKDYAFHCEKSAGSFLSEEEAVRDILYRRLERTERQPVTRWNRTRR
eukprot:symbB.v1.2.023732.t1/scaffold2195.1/size86141/4